MIIASFHDTGDTRGMDTSVKVWWYWKNLLLHIHSVLLYLVLWIWSVHVSSKLLGSVCLFCHNQLLPHHYWLVDFTGAVIEFLPHTRPPPHPHTHAHPHAHTHSLPVHVSQEMHRLHPRQVHWSRYNQRPISSEHTVHTYTACYHRYHSHVMWHSLNLTSAR